MPSLATSLLLLKGISPSSGQKDAIISGDIVDTVIIPEGLRVSKGFGTRGYNTVRLSVIAKDDDPFKEEISSGQWDHSEPFKWVFKNGNRTLNTKVVKLGQSLTNSESRDGTTTTVHLSPHLKIPIKSLPKQGQPVAGVLIKE